MCASYLRSYATICIGMRADVRNDARVALARAHRQKKVGQGRFFRAQGNDTQPVPHPTPTKSDANCP